MQKISLNGEWTMQGNGFLCTGQIPGSVYSFLLSNSLMEDPHFRTNEIEATRLLDYDYSFSREFEIELPDCQVLLHCDGLDTLCDIYINSQHIAKTANMHRSYEFDISSALKEGKNSISVVCHSPNKYVSEMDEQLHIPGPPDCLPGFPHLRKASCMMGWDWGPRLPDAGIWRDIYLVYKDSARIVDFELVQEHRDTGVYLLPKVKLDADAEIRLELCSPDKELTALVANELNYISKPKLWWPSGLGEQNLYTVTLSVLEDGKQVDFSQKKIGLRELKLIREKDKYGASFCHEINGIRFFAMGADYIPEDNILSRITKERTEVLLGACKSCNFNAIRVWGGGYYPDDYFFELCDELGLVVFMDMMFACMSISPRPEFMQEVVPELYDNLKRIRHHACLAVISGNNEIEELCSKKEEFRRSYLELFEDRLPAIIEELCPYIPYVPSSPSSIGQFIEPQNENFGDSHYWAVWHSNLPFREYRQHYFRYLSEFGFESFPCEKTVNSFTLPEDRNIFTRTMEMHQRCMGANKKILMYLADTFRYPYSFGTLLYASQLLQAEAIKFAVEHLRRNRGRCMGTLYWQLNDIWPVASWASIDYFGRYKALQYVAKRFYAPVLLSCRETGETDTRPYVVMTQGKPDYETRVQLSITNDSPHSFEGEVKAALYHTDGTRLSEQSYTVSLMPFSVLHLEELDFNKCDVENTYYAYSLIKDGEELSFGTSLFTVPKHFNFVDPELEFSINEDEITVYAKSFAKYVEIYSPDSDFVLSDNYFDMNKGSKTVRIVSGTPRTIELRSAYDIR